MHGTTYRSWCLLSDSGRVEYYDIMFVHNVWHAPGGSTSAVYDCLVLYVSINKTKYIFDKLLHQMLLYI